MDNPEVGGDGGQSLDQGESTLEDTAGSSAGSSWWEDRTRGEEVEAGIEEVVSEETREDVEERIVGAVMASFSQEGQEEEGEGDWGRRGWKRKRYEEEEGRRWKSPRPAGDVEGEVAGVQVREGGPPGLNRSRGGQQKRLGHKQRYRKKMVSCTDSKPLEPVFYAE